MEREVEGSRMRSAQQVAFTQFQIRALRPGEEVDRAVQVARGEEAAKVPLAEVVVRDSLEAMAGVAAEMSDDIPYDDYKLREAYRRGWKAWAKGRPPHTEFRHEDVREAWLRGYEDAQTQDSST